MPETCKGCKNNTEFRSIGFVPLSAIEDSGLDNAWVQAKVCTNCGAYNIVDVTDQDIRRADERYLHTISEEGVITREKARELLGLE